VAGTEPGLLGETRRKLLSFLESSAHYTPEKMLSRFPFDALYEERALLLSRIGQHDQVLNIYAHRLRNDRLAEEYCRRHYDPDHEEARDVYLHLLRVYLRPPEDERPSLAPALALLNRYHDKIDAPRALELLPPQTPVARLLPFLEALFREKANARREARIEKSPSPSSLPAPPLSLHPCSRARQTCGARRTCRCARS
jgi:hypothetical protein